MRESACRAQRRQVPADALAKVPRFLLRSAEMNELNPEAT